MNSSQALRAFVDSARFEFDDLECMEFRSLYDLLETLPNAVESILTRRREELDAAIESHTLKLSEHLDTLLAKEDTHNQNPEFTPTAAETDSLKDWMTEVHERKTNLEKAVSVAEEKIRKYRTRFREFHTSNRDLTRQIQKVRSQIRSTPKFELSVTPGHVLDASSQVDVDLLNGDISTKLGTIRADIQRTEKRLRDVRRLLVLEISRH